MVTRIAYAGCGLAGRTVSLLSIATQLGVPMTALQLADNEQKIRWPTEGGGSIDLVVSVSARRAHDDYEPTDPHLDPRITMELDRLALANGYVFVLDSQTMRAETNLQEYASLVRDLSARGVDAHTRPIVFQVNKRDLPSIVTMDWVRANFFADRCAYVESIATKHIGTVEAMRELLRLTGAIE